MEKLTVLIVLLVVLVFVSQELKNRGKSKRGPRGAALPQKKPTEEETEKPKARYRDKFQLLNGAEQELLRRLHEAAEPENLYVFSQVSMSQLFYINSNMNGAGAFQQLGEIGRKSVDFLLVRKKDTGIVAAIELNGPTHDSEKQKASDEKKQEALQQAGIPLITFYPQTMPDVQRIKETIQTATEQRERYERARNERFGRR